MPTNVRTYGHYLNTSITAMLSAVDRANSINDPYYKESSLILFANAWELFAKSLLIKHGGESLIYETGSRKERTITAEYAINKLKTLGYITEHQAIPIQQIISLRNEATHTTLPDIPDEIIFHLEYYSVRYFKELVDVNFKSHSKLFKRNFLSISFDSLTTYADGVKKLITKARKNKKPHDLRLAYLLERGTVFSGSEYIRQSDFDKSLLAKQTTRPMYKLKLGDYTRNAEMIVVVPIQAPSGTQADIKLTKSSKGAITVNFDKRATDDDYPYITKDLSSKLGKSLHFVSRILIDQSMKGNALYHQRIRTGSRSSTNKYSDTCLSHLKDFLIKNPDYKPSN